ncbi:MAG: hypothetical protein IT458_19915 [Planctomycetes bacterium]|nr:hypothetical protein [Planctomycetota bacterium]
MSARRIAHLLRLSVAEVVDLAERYGVHILRVPTRAGRPKIRVEIAGMQRAIAEMSRRPLGASDRAELAVALALEEAGIQPRRRRREVTP